MLIYEDCLFVREADTIAGMAVISYVAGTHNPVPFIYARESSRSTAQIHVIQCRPGRLSIRVPSTWSVRRQKLMRGRGQHVAAPPHEWHTLHYGLEHRSMN